MVTQLRIKHCAAAILILYRTILIIYRAILTLYRAILILHRAILMLYRAGSHNHDTTMIRVLMVMSSLDIVPAIKHCV